MRPEVWAAWATVGTMFVIAASAIAALVQLRHMHASNQLEALLSVERDFRSPEVQAALRYVQDELPERLQGAGYRRELAEIGFVDIDVHPELILCNWFNEMGALLKHHLVTQDAFMDLFARLIIYYWKSLGPVVAIMRRKRGDYQYHDFEYLAIRAQQWLALHPTGLFPSSVSRQHPADPWREADMHQDYEERV